MPPLFPAGLSLHLSSSCKSATKTCFLTGPLNLEQPTSQPFRLWPYFLGAAIGLVVGLVLFIYLGARHIDDRTRAWVISELSARFDSDVELQSLHVDTTPRMQVTGEGLTLRYHGRTDVPPLLQIARFSFNLGFLGIVHVPRHIKGVTVENMVITIPPGRDPNAAAEPPRESTHIPRVIFNEIVCTDADLIILPKKAGKDPLDFAIHDLVMNNVGDRKPFDFHGTLTNAKPKGEIATKGTFGPWNSAEPSSTPLAGEYHFADADLDPFAGIGGTLSSVGKYQGQLNQIQVQGQTETPNFSLDPVGRPVPLHTEFSATVDGTDGDTYLHPVRATLIHSLIIANGSVIRVKGQGHIISLNIYAPNARLQDILRLATKSLQPVMTGTVTLKTKMLLPPGKEKVIHRLSLDGDFGVNDAEFASVEVRDKLESLSRHALGKPKDEDAGSAVTDLLGHFRLDHDVAAFPRLSFSIPGAEVRLLGKYDLPAEALDFRGNLRMQAKLSQTVTGKKSFFLKLADPFFKKDGAGSVVPIRITGTRDAPHFALDLFHNSDKK